MKVNKLVGEFKATTLVFDIMECKVCKSIKLVKRNEKTKRYRKRDWCCLFGCQIKENEM